MTTDKQRLEMAYTMDLLVRNKNRVHYAQIRPMQTNSIRSVAHLRRKLHSVKGIVMDCSESSTLICRLAGLRDPNGLHYNGEGYTGTQLTYLEHYLNPVVAGIGALCVFGEWPGKHVCVVRKTGRDPLLFSHGCEADPSYYPFSVMREVFPNDPYTFLSIAKLGFGKAA